MKEKIITLYKECKATNTFFIWVILNGIYNKIKGKNILARHNVVIKGLKNISTSHKTLKIGLHDVGFTHPTDKTVLNIKGKLIIKGNYTITQGCRFYIGKSGSLQIGNGGYVNAGCIFIILHNMTIGENCIISWNCQFLDEDYHDLQYEGKKEKPKNIIIGNNVWIGSNCFIYKGVFIADGCVIGANAVVRSSFREKNALIGGNPARIIKSNVSWSEFERKSDNKNF